MARDEGIYVTIVFIITEFVTVKYCRFTETVAETVRMNSEVANGLANHECSDVATMTTSSAVAIVVQAYCNIHIK